MLALKYGLSESLSGYGSGKADQVESFKFILQNKCLQNYTHNLF